MCCFVAYLHSGLVALLMLPVIHLHSERHPAMAQSEPSPPCSDVCFALAADCLRGFILTPVCEFVVHILIPPVFLVSRDQVSRWQNKLNKISGLVWTVCIALRHVGVQTSTDAESMWLCVLGFASTGNSPCLHKLIR